MNINRFIIITIVLILVYISSSFSLIIFCFIDRSLTIT